MSAVPVVPAPPVGLVDTDCPWRLLIVAGSLGVAVQGLFWDAGIGLNAPVAAGLVLAAVIWVARSRGIAMTVGTAGVAAVAGIFSVALAVRAEPVTTAVNAFVALAALAILVHAYPSERWLRYGLRDWLLAALAVAGHQVVGAPELLCAASREQPARATLRRRWQRAAPFLHGLLIAAPVVVLLAALLASADLIFAARLTAIGELVWRISLEETLGRALVAVMAAWVIAGGLWHQLQRREPQVLADEAVPRVLGFTEAVVILTAVNMLFGAFVIIQARYFFGGRMALVAEGLTYAEYARRGFGELVVVALASLCLHLALAGLTRREHRYQRVVFSALASIMTLLVLVILASSFQRLLLYEQVFGFTRIRTVVHVFMVWLGVLLVALLLLELGNRVRLFLLASLVATVGFAATLNIAGVDALIVRQNVAHAQAGHELDTAYLAALSPDAAPALARALASADGAVAADLRTALGCVVERGAVGDWRSLRLADVRARVVSASAPAVPQEDGCPRP